MPDADSERLASLPPEELAMASGRVTTRFAVPLLKARGTSRPRFQPRGENRMGPNTVGWALSLLVLAAALPGIGTAGTPSETPRANGAAATPLAIEQALDDVKSGDWILQWAAMSQLARWRTTGAAPQLKAVLAGKDHPWVRGRALVALADLLGEEVFDDAQARARDAAPELRAAAVEALGILGTPKAEAAIAEHLNDPAPEVRYQAVVAIARVRREKAWDTVRPLLDDKDPQLVRHAARALVHIQTPESHAQAIALLAHSDAGVRVEAARTLGRANVPEAIPALLRRMAADGDAGVRVACEKALAAFEPGALFLPMLAALRGERRECYGAALRVLALRPTREACEGVAALVREPADAYREVLPEAFQLLAALDPDRYTDIFARYLAHPSALVRGKAVESVGKCAKADQFALLRPLLLDREHAVRVAVLRTIRNLTDAAPAEGFPRYLADAIRQGDKAIRRAATDLLCERVPAAELPEVVALLAPVLGGKEKDEREYVAKALAHVGDEAVRRRIAQAQGMVTSWMLIGPFPYDSRNRGFGPAYFPEYEVDFARDYDPIAADPTATFRVGDATCGGEKRRAILVQPPTARGAAVRLTASFRLELPDGKNLRLATAIGLEDDAADSDGAQVEIAVNGQKLLERKLAKPEGWQPAEVALDAFAGQRATIELTVDPLASPRNDHVALAGPRLVAGDQVLADLLEMADSAPVRIAEPGARNRLAWQRYQASRMDGEVSLYDVYPPPIDGKLAYGVADLTMPEESKATLTVKSDDGFILWLNGVKVAERPGAGEQKAEVTLRQGPSRLLIKSFNHREWWLYSVRLTDPEGRALGFRQDAP